MHKFFTPAHMFSDTHAKITGEDVKHIYKVLRVKAGEKVVVNNLESEEFLGEVEEVNKQEVSIKILEKLDVNNESNLNITLFQGMPKAAKMDLIVQKCVELGVSEIILAYDKEYDNCFDKKGKEYRQKLIEKCEKYRGLATFYYLFDEHNLLNKKDAPCDKGKDILEELMKRRIKIK